MAQKTCRFWAVKAESLSDQPQCFQKYVKQYFELVDLFGIKCYVAMIMQSKQGTEKNAKYKRGTAPAFYIEHRKAIRDLPNKDFHTWLDEQKKINIFEFYKIYNDGT